MSIPTWQTEKARIDCQCAFSDAHRCAVDKRLTRQVACWCECHQYVHKQVDELRRAIKPGQ